MAENPVSIVLKICLVVLFAWIGNVLFLPPAYCDDSADYAPLPFDAEKFEETADWMIRLSARDLKDYLKFKGSPFHPLVCVTVTSQVRQGTGVWNQKRSYQTMWFHNGAPVGCRRFESLKLPKDSQGIIKIERSLEGPQNTKALINATLRLLPDIYLQQSVPLVVVVPHEMCQSTESDLSSFRFYKVKATTGDASALILHMVSSPAGYDRYFYYTIKSGEILD